MNELQLYKMQEMSAYILNSWTLGLREAQLTGRKAYFDRYQDAKRLHYLYAVIDAAYVDGESVFIGSDEVEWTYIVDTYHKIWHYRGTWIEAGIHGPAGDPDDGDDVDIDPGLKNGVIPGDGDDGSDGSGEDGDPGDNRNTIIIITEPDPEWRIGIVPVVPSDAVITFMKNGVPSALPDANYVVDMYLITTTGRMQRNLVIGEKLASGFTVVDILEAGNLHYQAIPIT